MAVQVDQKSRLFSADYQAPFGGIDSSAFATAINERNFAFINQAVSNDNYLLPVGWELVINLLETDEVFLGYIPIAESSVIGYVITSIQVIEVAADGTGGLTFTSKGTYAPAKSTYGYFSFVVIEDQLIWTTETWSEIWAYDTTELRSPTLYRLTNYVGGGYLGVVDDQIINLGGVSALDGLVPYRISWSAPGAYTSWVPYDVGSNTGDFAAGFNNLPSTSDRLVGMLTVGTVAYLFRAQGVTQMSPTGNGIQPFNFNHLWASQLGVGTVFPGSIAQYGSLGAFIADSGFYTLGLSGLREVSGVAKDFLFRQINNISNFAVNSILPQGIITTVCVPYLLTHPSVYYVVGFLNSMTNAPTGVAPSANTYALYAIDLEDGDKVYSLGTVPVAVNPAVPSAYAVGQLAFINKSYIAAPTPLPPPPPTFALWSNTTYYTPFNVWAAIDFPITNPETASLYELTTAGTVPSPLNTQGTVITPPTTIGEQINVGSAVYTYKGPAKWTAGAPFILGQFTALLQGNPVPPGNPPPAVPPYPYLVGYRVTQAGISGGSQAAWSTNPGDVVNDGTAVLQCIGPVSRFLAANLTPSFATSYNVAPDTEIVDPGLFIQQNTSGALNDYKYNYTVTPPHSPTTTFYVFLTLPGAFSQFAAPPWNDTTGGVTNEAKTLNTPFPAASWLNLGPTPPPPTIALVGANVSTIVPLFIAINNVNLGNTTSTLTGIKLVMPAPTDTGIFVFRKESLGFYVMPTVSKIGFLAALIDPSKDGSILVSIDGGTSWNQFPPILIPSGGVVNDASPTGQTNSGQGIIDNCFSDAVVTLKRPQLAVQLNNVTIVQAWYQGTIADYAVI